MRTYQKRVAPNLRRKSAWEPVPLETDKPLIIYPRQSTLKQKRVNIYSREMQTTDLVQYAQELGWQADVKTITTEEDLDRLIESVAEWKETSTIIVLELDLGLSGTLKIEKRK